MEHDAPRIIALIFHFSFPPPRVHSPTNAPSTILKNSSLFAFISKFETLLEINFFSFWSTCKAEHGGWKWAQMDGVRGKFFIVFEYFFSSASVYKCARWVDFAIIRKGNLLFAVVVVYQAARRKSGKSICQDVGVIDVSAYRMRSKVLSSSCGWLRLMASRRRPAIWRLEHGQRGVMSEPKALSGRPRELHGQLMKERGKWVLINIDAATGGCALFYNFNVDQPFGAA